MTTTTPTQTNRHLKITQSPLGDNDLLLLSLQGEQAISGASYCQLTLLSCQADVAADKMIGQPLGLSISNAKNQQKQYLHGYIGNFTQQAFARHGDYYLYQATLYPMIEQLNNSSHCQLFQDKTSEEIITTLCQTISPKMDIKFSAQQNTTHPYRIQYNESDLAFLERLLADEGLYYFIKYQENKHTLVISDQTADYLQAPDEKMNALSDETYQYGLLNWNHRQQFIPHQLQISGHDYENASNEIHGNLSAQAEMNNQTAQLHDYHTKALNNDSAARIAKVGIETYETHYHCIDAESTVYTLCAGQKIQLANAKDLGENNDKFVITHYQFQAQEASLHQLIGNSSATDGLRNQFTCIPVTQVYRPAPIAPPIAAIQEAIISSDSAENKVCTDELGRMKVTFFWQDNSDKEQSASCFLRAIQYWEGFYRVGTSVIVGFLNNDINQPIILGPVNDSNNKPLYNTSDSATKSALYRRPGSSGEGEHYNQIYFEDKPDNEEMGLLAGKDMLITVNNNRTTTITQDDKTTINKGNREVILTEGNENLTINKGNMVINIQEGKCSITSKGDMVFKADGDITLDAQGNINLQSGQSTSQKSGTGFEISAGTSLDLKGSAGASVKSFATLDLEGNASTTVKSSGVTAIKGALVQVN